MIPQGRRGAFYSNANIIGCVISGNTTLEEGGGVDMLSGNANIVNCTLADNFATGFGGVCAANTEVTWTLATLFCRPMKLTKAPR